MKRKLAVIGASIGQLPLVRKARDMGVETHCFAWDKGAVCKEYADFFYPISIFDTGKIINICRSIGVEGVITNASEETALVASKISEALGLTCTHSKDILNIQNKRNVRKMTETTLGLRHPAIYTSEQDVSFPCVVKPIKGSAKRGVSLCTNMEEFTKALSYAKDVSDDVLIEEYIDGKEYSVECLSFEGIHHVIQITEKITTGFPHFVELEHHQPALLSDSLVEKIKTVVPNILIDINFANGASHIEIKIHNDNIYLIEVNPRGGGDRISDTLVSLSTDCDYLRDMILIALNRYVYREVHVTSHSGIIYLCKQNEIRKSLFDSTEQEWLIEKEYDGKPLSDSTSNYDRNGFMIYQTKKNAK